MTVSSDQRRLLGLFLRGRRATLSLADAGLQGPRAERRRTPGLRREELAQACGMSPTWYTWLEQGRDIAVSAAALARLADGLRLSAAERAYLFELGGRRDPAWVRQGSSAEPGPLRVMRRALDAIDAPAYLLDPLWQALAWNTAAAALFSAWVGGPDPCLLGFVFMAAEARTLIPDWENRARRLVAEFRADTGARRDPGLTALVERLRRGSDAFASFWDDHAVLAREGGERLVAHPDGSLRRYDQITMSPAGWPGHKLVMLLPDREPPGQ